VIIFDSSYLVVLLHPAPPPAKDRNDKPVAQFRERVAYLAARMDVSNEVIGVPAPAMAEVLVRAGNGRAQYVAVLSDTWKFQIIPFDSRAAIETSELIAKVKSNREVWATWAKIKFDIQIVAIAKAESATAIYSDDKDIENLAKRLKIPVIRICDLPLPPTGEETNIETGPVGSQGLLNLSLGNVAPQSTSEVKINEGTGEAQLPGTNSIDGRAAQVGENNQLQATPAHPASVRGSDSGRAQGEAAREKAEKTEAEKKARI
jgi:hypothetical protein